MEVLWRVGRMQNGKKKFLIKQALRRGGEPGRGDAVILRPEAEADGWRNIG